MFGDSAYTDYQLEDALMLKHERQRNSKRPDTPWMHYIKQTTRHLIETVFSQLTQRFPQTIHPVTFPDFLLKLTALIFALTLDAAFLDK